MTPEVCAAPGCEDEPHPQLRVCIDHKPELHTREDIARVAAECRLERHGNGWRISHPSGAFLPVPTRIEVPPGWPAKDVIAAQFASRADAERALAVFRRGAWPAVDGEDDQLQLFDQEAAA